MKRIRTTALFALLTLSLATIGASVSRAAPVEPSKAQRHRTIHPARYGQPQFRTLRAPRAVVSYDTELGAYVVLGKRNHFYSNGRYFRSRFGAWEVSSDLQHWSPLRYTRVPFILRVHTAAKSK